MASAASRDMVCGGVAVGARSPDPAPPLTEGLPEIWRPSVGSGGTVRRPCHNPQHAPCPGTSSGMDTKPRGDPVMSPFPSPSDLADGLKRAAEWLRNADRVAVLTGAGVSAESGIATFRDGDGRWEGQRVEELATPAVF